MAPETMPEPEGPEDELYVVTAAGVEALHQSVAAFDSEQKGEGKDVVAER